MPASAAALRAAIHSALKADGPLAAMLGGAKIYDEPPREASLPYVPLGEAIVSDRSTATEAGDEHARKHCGAARQFMLLFGRMNEIIRRRYNSIR